MVLRTITEEASVEEISIIGVDIAKHVSKFMELGPRDRLSQVPQLGR